MENLLEKIKRAKASQKCQLMDEAYVQVVDFLNRLEINLENTDVLVLDSTLDKVELVLETLDFLINGLEKDEVERITKKLEADYQDCLDILKFFQLLDEDGRGYRGDYDGTEETIWWKNKSSQHPIAKDFHGHYFEVPSRQQVLTRLKPQHFKLYKQMEAEGLRPRLQITPIALAVRTLARNIDTERGLLLTGDEVVYLWGKIKEQELQYSPSEIGAMDDKTSVQVLGGFTKSQWIRQNNGYLLDIVVAKPQLDSQPDVQVNSNGQINYVAVQAENFFNKLKKQGLRPLNVESYLVAQMRAIKAGELLDKERTLLLDSCLENPTGLIYGSGANKSIYLDRQSTDRQHTDIHCRYSIRI